jgi:hypothetical protein
MIPKNAKKKDSTLALRPSEHAPRTRINASFQEKKKTANTLGVIFGGIRRNISKHIQKYKSRS